MSSNLKGKLYICATPIGHLSDLSIRAIEILKAASIVFCEDTRVAKKLCMAHHIHTPLKTLNAYNEEEGSQAILSYLLKGEDVALISDAGTPNISDPGAYVVDNIVKKGYQVLPIPGPSSVVSLLSVSGILANHFCFGGFFPKKVQEFETFIKGKEAMPIVFFESPKRIQKTLEYLKSHSQLLKVVVAKELTKTHEQIWYDLESVLEAIQVDPSKSKGEWLFITVFRKVEDADLIKTLKKAGFSYQQVMQLKALDLVDLPRNNIYAEYKK